MKGYVCRKLQYELERVGRKPDYTCEKVKYYLERVRRGGEPCILAFLMKSLDACSRGAYGEVASYLRRAVSGCCSR